MKHKLSLTFISSLIVLFFFSIYSCKKPAPTEPQSSTTAVQPPASGSTDIGTITYYTDASREKTATLDTTAVDISTTDADGIKWDLSIPRQDIGAETAISIIPLKSVKSDTTYNITNGVVFQPDGFQFSNPATLTVTVPRSSQKYAFYLFSQDGKSVNFAYASGTNGVYKISITHFSGAAAGVPANFNRLCSIGTSRYNAALEEENKIINREPVVPVPPDIEIGCGMDVTKEQTIDNYIKQFIMPEDTVIKKMLGALSAMQLAGCNSSIVAGGLAQASKLGDHLAKKAQMAYDQYSGDNKKYPAVVKAMLSANAQLKLLGGSPSANVLSELGTWAKKYYDDQLAKVTQDHDYTAIKSLLELSAQARLFGVDAPYYNQIIQAVSFKFSLNEGVELIINDNGIPPDTEQIIIQGAITLQPDISGNGLSYTGGGNINYVYGLTQDACYDAANNPQGGHDKIVLPQSFYLSVIVDSLNLCKQNYVSIRFDSLGSAFEKWDYGYDISGANNCTNVGSDQQHSSNASLTLDLNEMIFSNESYYDYDINGFNLSPFLHNGNINAVDTTYEVNQTVNSGLGSIDMLGQLHVKLVHSPQ